MEAFGFWTGRTADIGLWIEPSLSFARINRTFHFRSIEMYSFPWTGQLQQSQSLPSLRESRLGFLLQSPRLTPLPSRRFRITQSCFWKAIRASDSPEFIATDLERNSVSRFPWI